MATMRAVAITTAAPPLQRGLRSLYSSFAQTRVEKPPPAEPSTNLFVSGLSKRTTSEGLRDAFAKFGEVMHAKVVTDRVSGYSKGFGFVRYATIKEAEAGIKGMDGQGRVKSSLTDHARSQLVHGSLVDVLLKDVRVHPYEAGQRTVKVVCRDIGVGFLSGATRERKYCTVEDGYDDYYKRRSRSDGRPAA